MTRRLGLPFRQRQLPALHAEGDPRAAGGDRPTPCAFPRSGDGRGIAAVRTAVQSRDGSPAHDRCLRHGLSCRAGRQLLVRAIREDAGRDRCRLGIPLSRAADAERAAWRCSSPNRARPPIRLRRCAMPRRRAQKILSVVNVPTSTIARESDVAALTLAGPEIGVASTKAFTCQLARCLSGARHRARRGADDDARRGAAGRRARAVPGLIARGVAEWSAQSSSCAQNLAKARDVLYLGRGTSYPLALEGALKLKEISYIHAEGYAAGEMKHGPIALIDEIMPVIVLAPRDALFDKTLSNVQEVTARGGDYPVPTPAGDMSLASPVDVIALPTMATGFAAARLCRAGAIAGLSHGGRHGHRRRPAAQSRQERDGGIGFSPPVSSAFPASAFPRALRSLAAHEKIDKRRLRREAQDFCGSWDRSSKASNRSGCACLPQHRHRCRRIRPCLALGAAGRCPHVPIAALLGLMDRELHRSPGIWLRGPAASRPA